MEHGQNPYAAKNCFMAGRDPILPACLRAKSPSGLRGSRPAMEYALRFLVRCFAAYELLNQKGNLMPLLKPPDPQIATRRFFVRIEEPLALSMERYAEFLGTDNLDHVVCQALQFIFKRDTQFKSWLEKHPEATPRPPRSKASSLKGGPLIRQSTMSESTNPTTDGGAE
jgi:hypothetical protein